MHHDIKTFRFFRDHPKKRERREELKRKIEAGLTDKRFGRTAKKINLRSVIDMKNKGMTWANISDYVNVSVPTIQRRLKDAGYTFESGRVVKV
jgi:DNA invertase Pin-like site-specific DNA recombinase